MPKSKSRGKRHNSQFKRQEQRHSRNIKESVAWMYAALAVVLHARHGFGKKRIMQVLTDMQALFESGDTAAIVRRAYRETGLVLMSETTAKELEIDIENEVKL